MRRDANFSNVITEILRKSKKREERDMMCQREKKKKKNYGNTIVEIRREKIFAIMAI